MTGRIQKHHDAIVMMRVQGKSMREIAEALGLAEKQVRNYAFNVRMSKYPLLAKISFIQSLTGDEIAKLQDLAARWGCATLAEAATEILKDALAEAQARDAGQ